MKDKLVKLKSLLDTLYQADTIPDHEFTVDEFTENLDLLINQLDAATRQTGDKQTLALIRARSYTLNLEVLFTDILEALAESNSTTTETKP